jgi:hypothetical protein
MFHRFINQIFKYECQGHNINQLQMPRLIVDKNVLGWVSSPQKWLSCRFQNSTVVRRSCRSRRLSAILFTGPFVRTFTSLRVSMFDNALKANDDQSDVVAIFLFFVKPRGIQARTTHTGYSFELKKITKLLESKKAQSLKIH